jgi:hypothetical protein
MPTLLRGCASSTVSTPNASIDDTAGVGHVLQGRYKAIIAQKESYLLELVRYIVLNPVRAGMLRSAKDWPWCSYRASQDTHSK